MGRYAEITAVNMADVIAGLQAFFTAGGWAISGMNISETYNRTMFTVTKNGMGHRVCCVYSGKFPFAVTQSGVYSGSWQSDANQDSYGTYEAAVGMYNSVYDGGDYFLIAPHLSFPCRCFFFETSDHSVLLSFEVASGRWQNIFSGTVNKSLTGNWDGGMLMTGATSPGREWVGVEDDGFMQPNGSTGPGYNFVPVTTLMTHNGYLIQDRDYNGASPNTPWPGGSFTANFYNDAGNEYYFPVKRAKSGGSYSVSAEGQLINSIGANALMGLPTLFPMTVRFDNIFGAYLNDIWCCPQAATVPGGVLWMGTQKYITIPVYLYNTTSLGMAVRVN